MRVATRWTSPCTRNSWMRESERYQLRSGFWFSISKIMSLFTFHTLYFSHLYSALHACRSTHSLRSSNTNLLSVPSLHTSFGTQLFQHCSSYNLELTPALRIMSASSDIFHHHLKTHYFQQAFQPT